MTASLVTHAASDHRENGRSRLLGRRPPSATSQSFFPRVKFRFPLSIPVRTERSHPEEGELRVRGPRAIVRVADPVGLAGWGEPPYAQENDISTVHFDRVSRVPENPQEILAPGKEDSSRATHHVGAAYSSPG